MIDGSRRAARWPAAFLAGSVLALLLPHTARAATWGDVEVMPFLGSSDQLGPVKTDPLGNYFVSFGSAGSLAKAREKHVVRPPGGGQAFAFPRSIPVSGAVDVDFEFDAAGNSWWIWATGSKIQITNRPAGPSSLFGSAIQLDSGPDCDDAAVGVAPNGDVLAAWTKAGDLCAAVKRAGDSAFSAQQIVATEATATSGGYIVYAHRLWATLDEGGSAVLVWEQWPLPGGTAEIKQSVRSAGALAAPNFGSPTMIASDIYQAFYAEGLGKHAALVWKKDEGDPGSSSGAYSMRALERAPGSGFSGAGTLVSDEEENGVGVGAPQLSVASDGSAAVAWWERDADFVSCPPPALQYAKMAVTGQGGGSFGPAIDLVSGSDPAPNDPAIAIGAAGSWVAAWRASTPAGDNPCAQQTRTVETKASSGETATYDPVSYDSGSVRAAAQPTGNGFEGLVVWIDASTDDLQAARFGEPASATTTTSTSSTTTPASSTTTISAGTTTTIAPVIVCGDATGDGRLTASDALAALRSAVGSGTCALCLCDVSGDGQLTATDALAILRAAVGLTQGPLDGCPQSC